MAQAPRVEHTLVKMHKSDFLHQTSVNQNMLCNNGRKFHVARILHIVMLLFIGFPHQLIKHHIVHWKYERILSPPTNGSHRYLLLFAARGEDHQLCWSQREHGANS